MKKVIKEKNMRSNHPYEEYIPEGATKLIIGSIPPSRFCMEQLDIEKDDVRFYYGSRKNHFWKLIEEVTGEKLDFENTEIAIQQRKDLLKKLNIGITDIIQSCIHEGGKSDDKSLKDIDYKPIAELLMKHSDINTLICTSVFVKNKLKKIISGKYYKETQRKGIIEINNKKYDVIILYSPSPYALLGMGPGGSEKRREQYADVFNN